MLELLNERFRRGHPSSSLSEAGVLLRQFDRTEDQTAPWHGCADAGAAGQDPNNGDCALLGNRLSAMIIFAGQRAGNTVVPIFGHGPGVIFNTGAVGITCGYVTDGGTRGKPDGCGNDWCSREAGIRDGWCDGRPYTPSLLDLMLTSSARRGGYNEVIIDSAALDVALPYAIDAFFYVGDADVDQSADGAVHARVALRAFRRTYGTTAHATLVRLDPTNWTTPFSFAEDDPQDDGAQRALERGPDSEN
jgi:hypothetical protein